MCRRPAITRAIADQARTIRASAHTIDAINRLNRVRQAHLHQSGREPPVATLARKLTMPEAKVREFQKVAKEPVSLELPAGENGDATLGDLIEDQQAITPLDAAMQAECTGWWTDCWKG